MHKTDHNKYINEIKRAFKATIRDFNSVFSNYKQAIKQEISCTICKGYVCPVKSCEKVFCLKDNLAKIKRPNQKTVYFDTGVNFVDISGDGPREITSRKQIREIEKREGLVFGGSDLDQEAAHKQNLIKLERKEKSKKLAEKVVKTATEKGIL